jgi:hypothetical protein
MVSSIMTSSVAFQALPTELVSAICGFLLRFERVFISANPRNVEVLRAVANHDTFRHRVKEIIWDDAILEPVSNMEGEGPRGYSSDGADRDDDADDKGRIPRHFVCLCRDRISYSKSRLSSKNGQQSESTN